MRSAASLSYEQAQGAIDGTTRRGDRSLCSSPCCRPLWGAYASLALARTERAPLDLDLPERKILLDDKGRGTGRGQPSPPRCPPPDRGVHDRRQCRGGRDAGSQALAADLSGARYPVEGEARLARRVPSDDRTQAAEVGHAEAGAVQPHPRRDALDARRPSSSARSCCEARPRPNMARAISVISV